MKLDKNKNPIENAEVNEDATDDLEDDDDPEDEGAADDDEPEDEDDPEDDDEPEDEDDPEDDDEPEDEDDPEDDEDSEADPAKKRSRAQKRIKQLNAKAKDAQRRVKALEAELSEARKLSGDDGKAILAAAEKAGVLPKLLSAEAAKGLKKLDEDRAIADRLDELLDGDEEEFTIGEDKYPRRKVERLLKKRQEMIAEGERLYGPARDKAVKRAREVFQLGLKARKAGWDGETPGAKNRKGVKPAKGKKPVAKSSKAGKKAKRHSRRGKVDYSTATTSDEMLALIERDL